MTDGQRREYELPLWQRIADDLQRKISQGQFAQRFPGETELVAEYGVSRGTIRSALRPLRERGLISAERGRRPHVMNTSGSSSYGPIYSLHETVQVMGLDQRSAVVEQELAHDDHVAARLGRPDSSQFFHLLRIRHTEGEPLAVDDVWLPAAETKGLVGVDFSDTAVYKELRDVCGITLDGGREEIWAVGADETRAAALGCAVGEPLFKIERTSWHGGVPFEFRETYILGSRYSIVRSFTPTA
jgi:GntR family transcriptional regulator